jgi:hypothetical protein
MWPLMLLLTAVLTSLSGKTATAPPTLEWRSADGHRWVPLSVVEPTRTGFRQVDNLSAGLNFTNLLSDARSITNQIYLNGAGVAAGDVDGDGWCDLYFCGLDNPNALYRNLGSWRFDNITDAAGVACADQASTGAAFADIDGDHDLDLLVAGIFRGVRLFLNDGRGVFREATDAAGLRSSTGPASVALADIDGNGFLDLYVVNYRNDTMRDMPDIQFSVFVTNGVYQLRSVNGRPATTPDLIGRFTFDAAGGVLENGQADVLYRNTAGRFAPVDWTDGTFRDERGQPIAIPYDWGLSAMFHDLNGDGAPDLYVCNDFQSPDRLWINDGQGRFRAIAPEALRHTSLFSMAMDFADIDRDGFEDFFVADMLSPEHARRQVQVMDEMAYAQLRRSGEARPQYSRNMLFHNRGNQTFAEIAQLAGLDATEWTWSPVFLDVDLDGYEDLLMLTGHWRDAQNADVAREIEDRSRQRGLSAKAKLAFRLRFPRLDTPNFAYRNRGDLTFEEIGQTWGFDSRRVSQGIALADLDNDGDVDAAINCLNDPPVLLRNTSGRPRVAVRLRGQGANTHGVGARIRVRAPGLPPQGQEMRGAGRYLSGDDTLRTFAVAQATDQVSIEIAWRSGRHTVCANAPANRLYEFDEASALPPRSLTQAAAPSLPEGRKPASAPAPRFATPLFQNVSDLLHHQHVDEPFDDFARQTLLPRKLSHAGPGLAWFDFSGDGYEDLFIGAGRGGRLAVFRNNAQGGFVRQRAALLESPADRDFSALLASRPDATNLILWIGLDHYEIGAAEAPTLRQISMVTGEIRDDLWRSPHGTGPMALADVDGDGDLDLFVGGRLKAGHYPEAASSVLLKAHAGRYEPDAELTPLLAGIGLVNGAIFTDLEGNGWPDLVLACDWGPIRVFANRKGKWSAREVPIRWAQSPAMTSVPGTLTALTGWWNSVAAGDFDNDGRLDLVAGNWGRNTSRQRYAHQPLRLYYGRVEGLPAPVLLEAHHDAGVGDYVATPDLPLLRKAFPQVHHHFPTFAAYGGANLIQVLKADLPPMQYVSAATLDSLLLLNRGDHFEARPLPHEAQVAPAFGLAVGDLDGDGNEDLLVAQNSFGLQPAESRLDAGCGLWLQGDGQGGWRAMRPAESGVAIYGEGRGAALCDFDHDGRLDLVVSQNGGRTQLFHNVGARPGLRVVLEGPPANPAAVGAAVRLLYPGPAAGPLHEIRAGGGYLSQDAATVVLGSSRPPTSIEIRWPHGPREQVTLAPDQREFRRRTP